MKLGITSILLGGDLLPSELDRVSKAELQIKSISEAAVMPMASVSRDSIVPSSCLEKSKPLRKFRKTTREIEDTGRCCCKRNDRTLGAVGQILQRWKDCHIAKMGYASRISSKILLNLLKPHQKGGPPS